MFHFNKNNKAIFMHIKHVLNLIPAIDVAGILFKNRISTSKVNLYQFRFNIRTKKLSKLITHWALILTINAYNNCNCVWSFHRAKRACINKTWTINNNSCRLLEIVRMTLWVTSINCLQSNIIVLNEVILIFIIV